MASYAELKQDIADWLVAADISAKIPAFVRLAEDRHKWGVIAPNGKRSDYGGAIRVREMERRARSVGNNTDLLATPPDMLEFKTLSPVVDGVVGAPLTFLGLQEFANQVRQPSGSTLRFYTVQRREFRLDGALAETSELELIYYAPFPALNEDTDTNWLLDNCYHAYLYGTLCEAEPYIQDDRQLLWEEQYAKAVRGLNRTERAAQRSHAAATTRPLRAMP